MFGKGKNKAPPAAVTLGAMIPGEICIHKTIGKILVLDFVSSAHDVSIIAYPRKVAVPGHDTQTVIRHGFMAQHDIEEAILDPVLAAYREHLRQYGGLGVVGESIRKAQAVNAKTKEIHDEADARDLGA
jgi:hypothetical protein